MSDLIDILRKRKQPQEKQEKQEKQEEQKKISYEQWDAIKELYAYIEDWLSDLIHEKLILSVYEDITIKKQCPDIYRVRKLKLRVGEGEIEFIPNTRFYVGTTGKITMKTQKGSFVLIRDMDGIWRQLISKSPIKIETLTKPYFRCLLKAILD